MPAPVKRTEPQNDLPRPQQQLRKGVRLAINILDLSRINPHVRAKILKTSDGSPALDLNRAFKFSEEGDERFVEFVCDLFTAALAIDIVRSEGRVEQSTIARAYIKRGDSDWVRIPFNQVLTRQEGEHFVLDEKFFPVAVEAEPYSGGSAKRVLFRKPK